MKKLVLAPLVVSLLLVGLGAPATARPRLAVTGSFEAIVDFTSVTTTEHHGACLLTVNGTLRFTGTLVGEAPGTTTALIFASCEQVRATPPGTFADVFRFRGSFRGEIDGRAVNARLSYAGITRPGGAIEAVITLRGAALGVLKADARVAVGGTYAGFVTG